MTAVENLASQLEIFRLGWGHRASAGAVALCVPSLAEWLRVYGPEYADAIDGGAADPQSIRGRDDVGGVGRGRRRPPQGGRGDRRIERERSRTRLRLTSGLHRACLAAQGVPSEVIDKVVPAPPAHSGGILAWLRALIARRLNPGPPTGFEAEHWAALCPVEWVRSDLKADPNRVRHLVASLME